MFLHARRSLPYALFDASVLLDRAPKADETILMPAHLSCHRSDVFAPTSTLNSVPNCIGVATSRHLCLYDGQRILSGWTIFLQVGRYCICSGVCPKMTPLRLGKIPSSRRSMQPRARRNRSKSQRCASRVVHLLQLAQSALAAQEGATKARKKRFNVSVAFPLPSRA